MRPLVDLLEELAVSDRVASRRLLQAGDAALAAVEPSRLVGQALTAESGGVRVGDHFLPCSRLVVLAVGKAALGMAWGADRALGAGHPGGGTISRGLVISNRPGPVPPWAHLQVGDHPLPGPGSERAGQAAVELVKSVLPEEGLLALVSGGGSALLEVPRPGIDLPTLCDLNRRLIHSGAPIEVINQIRAVISQVKGGGLVSDCRGPVATLAISDVEDDPQMIASGPTAPPGSYRSSPRQIASYLEKYRIGDPLASQVLRLAQVQETHLPASGTRGDFPFTLLADGTTAGQAAVRQLTKAGMAAVLHPVRLSGDTVTATHAALQETPPGTVRVFTGETTLEVSGTGRGGRNQHAALTAALLLGDTSYRFLAIGTDGIDGPTDSAGALVDGGTLSGHQPAGRQHLARYDAHPCLEKARALLYTGPTGTNVADLWIVDKTPPR